MYIRTKIAKGHTYYQIVEGRREGGKVRQHVLCSLGTDDDPKAVRKSRARRLAQHRKELARLERPYHAGETMPAGEAGRRERHRRWIDALARDIAAIDRYLMRGTSVGTTKAE